jgi:hypothetical protein
VNGRSALLVSFLVYLALDPFVFDPGACVDGVHGARARIGGDLADPRPCATSASSTRP